MEKVESFSRAELERAAWHWDCLRNPDGSKYLQVRSNPANREAVLREVALLLRGRFKNAASA